MLVRQYGGAVKPFLEASFYDEPAIFRRRKS
jgi:hypothetical protein